MVCVIHNMVLVCHVGFMGVSMLYVLHRLCVLTCAHKWLEVCVVLYFCLICVIREEVCVVCIVLFHGRSFICAAGASGQQNRPTENRLDPYQRHPLL